MNEYKEQLIKTRKEILQSMKDMLKAEDIQKGYIWWMAGPVHETMWERLASLFITAGGTYAELHKLWPNNFPEFDDE